MNIGSLEAPGLTAHRFTKRINDLPPKLPLLKSAKRVSGGTAARDTLLQYGRHEFFFALHVDLCVLKASRQLPTKKKKIDVMFGTAGAAGSLAGNTTFLLSKPLSHRRIPD
ncbi:hypothetical protein ACFWZ1_09615 [Frateuria sp. GZRe14]|uniref:hypothetical protein n=1 Tax=Frateuria sp. GZRe14 TaxID=3351534 RepID=UPI003EDC3925